MRSLAEDVRKPEQDQQPDQRQDRPAHERAALPPFEIAVAPERELVGNGGHDADFARRGRSPIDKEKTAEGAAVFRGGRTGRVVDQVSVLPAVPEVTRSSELRSPD